MTALRWARVRAAVRVWLQVEAENTPAVALYESFGFREVHHYDYRQAPGSGD